MTREQNNNYQYTIQYKEKNKPLDTGTPNIRGSPIPWATSTKTIMLLISIQNNQITTATILVARSLLTEVPKYEVQLLLDLWSLPRKVPL